jgi:SSS family solute:Na+ symporter
MKSLLPLSILATADGSGSHDVLLKLAGVDYLILGIYFAFVIAIGWVLRKYLKTSKDFFESGRSLPAWVCALGFIGANLGAQEVIGMAASGAKYGIMTSHFYWIGAIPAMVFVAVFMMPFYYGSKARSVPEYLKLRFDEKTRSFNALTFAFMTIMSSGISMYALALLLNSILGWNFHLCIILSGVIVLLYIFMGGLTSAIYNEVLQFFLIVLGFLPLVLLGMKDVGGWHGLVEKLDVLAQRTGFQAGTYTQSWAHAGSASSNPMGVEWFGLAMGLGFVLSFGYWCTDFLVMQRAMAAKDMGAARRTPLLAAVPKMFFPFLVIFPGLIAMALTVGGHGFQLPPKDGSYDYNMVVPLMLGHYLPSGMLGIGLTALMASFMSGMAGNVTAFNTVFTYDLYQGHIKKDGTDAHYLGGEVDHGVRHPRQHGRGVLRRGVQQHHGRPPTGVCLCQCAAVRDVPAWHVLAANERPWRLLGPDFRHGCGGGPPGPDHSGRGGGGTHPGRVGDHRSHLPEHHGPELLDGHLRLDHLHARHDCHFAGDRSEQDGRPVARTRLFAHGKDPGT